MSHNEEFGIDDGKIKEKEKYILFRMIIPIGMAMLFIEMMKEKVKLEFRNILAQELFGKDTFHQFSVIIEKESEKLNDIHSTDIIQDMNTLCKYVFVEKVVDSEDIGVLACMDIADHILSLIYNKTATPLDSFEWQTHKVHTGTYLKSHYILIKGE